MKDTKNLIKKRDVDYPNLIKQAEINGEKHLVNYWKQRLQDVSDRIKIREENRKKK